MFESVDKILQCDHSNGNSLTVCHKVLSLSVQRKSGPMAQGYQAIRLVSFVLNLPNWQVLFWGEIQIHVITEGLQSILLIKKGFGAS